MTIAGFRARNHPQQVGKRGAEDDTDNRGTDSAFIRSLENELGLTFTLDVAASALNAKAPAFYTREDDGLSLPWPGYVWCNPPYSDCVAWVNKAWMEWAAGNSDGIVMLMPANRTEQRWWQTYIEPHRDRPPLRTKFLPGRMRFDRPGSVIGPKGDRPPFGCVLLIWEKP